VNPFNDQDVTSERTFPDPEKKSRPRRILIRPAEAMGIIPVDDELYQEID